MCEAARSLHTDAAMAEWPVDGRSVRADSAMPAVEPLLVVDVQRGFIGDFTDHIPGRVAELIRTERYQPMLFTRFINELTSPYHRLLQWTACSGPPETDLAPELTQFARNGAVFDKHGKTGLPDSLAEYLRAQQLTRVTIVGLDTDMCVLKVALDVFDLGIEPIVLVDCCASTAGLQAHLAGLAILSRSIGPHQLRLTQLNDGYVAGPPRADIAPRPHGVHSES
jgi:nicotinamidase-related amidase